MDHYKALAKAQAEMGPALKTATNPHFKKQYADLGAVQEACFDALRNNGFAVYQPIGRDENGPFVKTIFAHEGGETLECTVPLMVGKGDMQGLGSAITYARRYGLMAMAGIAPEDDDGNAAAKGKRDAEDAEAKAKATAAASHYTDDVVSRMQVAADGVEAASLLQNEQDKIGRVKTGYPDLFKRIETAAKNAGAEMREVA